LVHEFLRPDHVTSEEGHPDPNRAEEGDDLLREVERAVEGETRDRRRRDLPSRRIRLGGDLDDARPEDHEGPEDEGMQDARVPLAVDLALKNPVDDEILDAGGDVIPPSLAALSEEEVSDPKVQLAAEHREADDEEKRHRVGVAGGQDHTRGSEGAIPSSTRGSRLLEGEDDAFRVLLPDALGHASDVRFGVDFVIRLDRKSPDLGIRSDDDEHDLRRVLFEEPREPIDRGSGRRRHRLHEKEDGTAMRDDGGRKLGAALGPSVHAEVEGPMLVRESLAHHLAAHRGLEGALRLVAFAGRHAPAPWIASTTAWASPMFPPAATPRPPICAAAASLK